VTLSGDQVARVPALDNTFYPAASDAAYDVDDFYRSYDVREEYVDPLARLKQQVYQTSLAAASNPPNGFKNRANYAVTNRLNAAQNTPDAYPDDSYVVRGATLRSAAAARNAAAASLAALGGCCGGRASLKIF